MTEQGAPGFSMVGGYLTTKEVNPRLVGPQKYITASEILANVSIVAASIHYFLNLVASPTWQVEPADDSDAAKKAAEFVELTMNEMQSSWARTTKRMGMYRFYGFSVNEWTAKRREDGSIGYKSIDSRPQHSIERWDIDANGDVNGVWQRPEMVGTELYIPRKKSIYMVDDVLTDSPEGFGLLRHLAEPAYRYMEYLTIEGQGFERDFRGVPVGRAPLSAINDAVSTGHMKKEDGAALITGLQNFVTMHAKGKATGLLLDSRTYTGQTGEGGVTPSAQPHWGIELLTGDANGIEHVGAAINRLTWDMAMILGTTVLLGGKDSGNRALSEDQSRNLYLNVNACVGDIANVAQTDYIDPLWKLNAFDPKIKPKLKPEDVSFRSVESVTAALRDMATAGAVLMPDDPVINDVRDLMGVSRQPEEQINRALEDAEAAKAIAEAAANAKIEGNKGNGNSEK